MTKNRTYYSIFKLVGKTSAVEIGMGVQPSEFTLKKIDSYWTEREATFNVPEDGGDYVVLPVLSSKK